MTRKDIPNLISVLRIILVVPIVYFLLKGDYLLALVLFVVAGVSDALDGFLAKRFSWTSRLGSLLDPLADKFLLVSCFLVFVFIGLMPTWLFAMIVLRDLIVAFGALLYHLKIEKFCGEPPFSSKLNTTFQIVYLVMLIASQGIIELPMSWMVVVLYAVAATTMISGLEYIWVWGLKAWNARLKEQNAQQ
ncbi:MAG: CDP-alcohol phosphatidyltransferase family protein [Cycloclasticus sp.]|nr:CDP-alcohol phosphatidyltransferase family protein [Cycloclasticus sp.]